MLGARDAFPDKRDFTQFPDGAKLGDDLRGARITLYLGLIQVVDCDELEAPRVRAALEARQ